MDLRMHTSVTGTALRPSCLLLAAIIAGCNGEPTTAELLANAQQSQDRSDFKGAIIHLKNAATRSPANAEVRFALASAYLKTGDGPSAEKELRKAVALGGSSARAAPDLAAALLTQGKAKQAVDETTSLTATGPALQSTRGDAFLALGNTAQAAAAYRQALAGNPRFAGALIGLAKIAAAGKDVEEAHRLIAQAIAANPADAAPWIYKGQLLRQQKQVADAIGAFGKAITLAPSATGAYIERGNDYIATGNFAAARADIAAANKLAPGTLPVVYLQARLAATEGKYPLARELVQRILADAPEHLPTLLLAGMVEMQLGNRQAAEQHLRKYVERQPENVHPRKLLAQVLLQDMRPGDALIILKPMLNAATDDAQVYALAGEASMQRKEWQTAVARFDKASKLAPGNTAYRQSLALSQLSIGESDKAIVELKAATAHDPKSLEAGIALIQAELRQKQYDNALAVANTLERSFPGNSDVLNFKGGIYLVKDDLKAARASFTLSAAAKPDNLDPVSNLARMDRRAGRLDDAKKRYESFLAKNAGNFRAMWGLAEIDAAQGNAAGATRWLEKASAENPTALLPGLKLAQHYLQQRRAQDAILLLRRIQTSAPAHPALLDLLGQAQLASNDAGAALETFNKLVGLSPESPGALMRLAAAHLATGNTGAALEDFKRAIAVQPDYLPAHTGRIGVLMRIGRTQEALPLATQLQKQAPDLPIGHVLEGDLQIAENRAPLALAAYEKAFAITPTPELLIKIADTMALAGKSAEIEPRLLKWRQANPSDPVIPMYLAQRYSKNSQYSLAAAELRAVLALRPDNPVALNNLAWAYLQDKDTRALEMAERAAAVSADSAAALDTLGWILIERGQIPRALALLTKAAAMTPDAKDIRYHRAVALHKSGDKAGARQELERLLADKAPFASSTDAVALLSTL